MRFPGSGTGWLDTGAARTTTIVQAMGACVSGVIFLPPRPKRWRLWSAWKSWARSWHRANDPAVERGRPGPGVLRVRCRRRDGRHVIALSGALNLTSRARLVEALEDAIEDDEGQIVLDLSDLESIDSAGLGTILTAHLRACDELKLLVIVPGPPLVQRVLDSVHGPFVYVSSQGDRRGGRPRSRLGRKMSARAGREGAHRVFRSG